jgi:hypothetical protein
MKKIKVVPNINVERQFGLDCMLFSTLNIIQNSTLGSKRPANIEDIRQHSQFAKTPQGYYVEAAHDYLKKFYDKYLANIAFVQLIERQNKPITEGVDGFGIRKYENFKSWNVFSDFLDGIEKTENETIFSCNLTGGHGSLSHQIGIVFNGKSYIKMDSLTGKKQVLLPDEARTLFSSLLKNKNSVFYAKIKKSQVKIEKKDISTKVIKVFKKT